uniref:Uncharacterized protein n=1 Tax=Conchiformibius kuhniae TaxID=211502 RepID=A0A8T9MS48_9NEIS|nr:hypothetical protein LVJ77_06325 [Conchiformibius kuhniae]
MPQTLWRNAAVATLQSAPDNPYGMLPAHDVLTENDASPPSPPPARCTPNACANCTAHCSPPA